MQVFSRSIAQHARHIMVMQTDFSPTHWDRLIALRYCFGALYIRFGM
jgi:hypothetical protein